MMNLNAKSIKLQVSVTRANPSVQIFCCCISRFAVRRSAVPGQGPQEKQRTWDATSLVLRLGWLIGRVLEA